MADTKQIDWGDGSGEKITVTASSFVGNKGIQIQSPENVKVTPRSKTIVLKSVTDPTKVARINVTQEKAVYTYDFILTASVPTIAAKGGSSVITAQLKTYRNGNLVETKAVTPTLYGSGAGFSISGTTVTALNRTTVVGSERSITVTGKFSGTFDGQEVTATVVVKQEANSATFITYGTPVVSLSVSDIPASGGTISSGTVTYSQTRVQNYTSGSTSDLTPLTSGGTVSYSTAITASSLGTTVKARTKIGTLTATVELNGQIGSADEYVYQQANTYKPQVFGFGYLDESGEFINTALLSASGEGIIGAVVVLISYTSGTEIKGNCDLIGTVSYSTPYIQEITGGETGEPSVPYALFIQGVSRGKTIGPEEKVNLTAPITYKDITFTGTWELIVQANTVTEEWSSPSVTLKVDDIPASGGESSDYSTVTYSQEKRNVYTSGEYDVLQTVTTGGMVSFIRTVTGENLGTTIKSRTFLGYTRISVTLNGKNSSKDTATYQEANSIESYTGDIIFTIDKSSPISGSLVSISVTELLVLNYTEVFSSGASLAKTPPAFKMSVLPSGAGVITTAIATIQKNPSLTESRQITLRATVGTTSLYKDIVLIQNPFEPSLNLNKSVINFSQRGGSDTLQVTSNTEWDVNSNAEFAIPETLQIKYNPSTDVVELVDQPVQIIKKVQESDDYVLALVRIGAYQSSYKTENRTKAPSREDVRDAKNSAGYKNRNQLYLLTKTQDKSYHRIVGRQWFRDGNATSQIAEGREGQAKLYTAGMLITKPGRVVGVRGCELSVPLLKLAEEKLGCVRSAISVSWNDKTGRITFTTESEVNTGSSSQPRMPMVAQTSNNGPIGYILFKKKSTTQYLDVHGWEEVSNFTLARVLIDTNFVVKQLGSQFAVTVVFQYGED